MELTKDDLRKGLTYRGKRPRRIRGEYNDRRIVWISERALQYDGPSVRVGQHYPTISIEAFLKWAGAGIEEE